MGIRLRIVTEVLSNSCFPSSKVERTDQTTKGPLKETSKEKLLTSHPGEGVIAPRLHRLAGNRPNLKEGVNHSSRRIFNDCKSVTKEEKPARLISIIPFTNRAYSKTQRLDVHNPIGDK